MANWRNVKGGRRWVGKDEAKADGRVSRRQIDQEMCDEALKELASE